MHVLEVHFSKRLGGDTGLVGKVTQPLLRGWLEAALC